MEELNQSYKQRQGQVNALRLTAISETRNTNGRIKYYCETATRSYNLGKWRQMEKHLVIREEDQAIARTGITVKKYTGHAS